MENSLEPDHPSTDSLYERKIAHAANITFKNDRYTTPIIIEFSTNAKETSINVAAKHRIIFTAIKLLDPSAVIVTKTIKYHPSSRTIPFSS